MPSQLLLNINLPIKLPEMITPTLASRHGFRCCTPKYFALAFMFGPFKMRWNERFSVLPPFTPTRSDDHSLAFVVF